MLSELHLVNFRCHALLRAFDIGLRTAWIDKNGSGKSSIIEGIFFLSQCRSFRTRLTRDLIRWTASETGARGVFAGEAFESLSARLTDAGRILETDGQPVRLKDYWGLLAAVVVQNRDRELIAGASSVRRGWADALISVLDSAYLCLAQRAKTLLRQKNALLRKDNPNQAIWHSLTTQIREIGGAMHEARKRFSAAAEPVVHQAHAMLTRNSECLRMSFESATSDLSSLGDAELWAKELRQRCALLGPHRDDWHFSLDGQLVRQFGSEGQQKTAALAMRWCEVEMIRRARGKPPLILIDDALSELDCGRRTCFWEMLPAQAQVLATATRRERIGEELGFKFLDIASCQVSS